MYPEVYVFYTSLSILTVFLTYKFAMIVQYDKLNKNSVHFNPVSRIEYHVSRIAYRVYYVTREHVVRPVTFVVVKNVTYVVRGAHRSMNDIRYGRKKLGEMIEKKKDASGYVQGMIDEKSILHKKSKREL